MTQKEITNFLYSLYKDISPISISIECRKKHGIYDNKSFVYGESYLPSLYEIFSEVNPKPGEIFYDLGSGSGRVVLYAAMSFPFARCIGIELLDDLLKVSQTKLELFKKELPNLPGFDPKGLGEIKFIQGDFTKFDFSNANVIYMNSTCFDEKLMQAAESLFEKQLSPGTRVITLTKSFPSKNFKIIRNQLYKMEWGDATVYFHEKI